MRTEHLVSALLLTLVIGLEPCGASAESVKTITADGRTAMLHPNGTLDYSGDRPGLSQALRARPEGATLLVTGAVVPYGLWIDPSVWRPSERKENSAAEYEFVHAKGGGYAMVLAESTEVPIESWKEIVMENAKRVAPDSRITAEEKGVVNGAEVLLLETTGTGPQGPFVYYGYYYSGKQGAVQVITFTSPELFDRYVVDFAQLLAGFVVLATTRVSNAPLGVVDAQGW